MPELPEVETIRQGLSEAIVGKTIASVEALDQKVFQADTVKIVNQKIGAIHRRAKTILVNLTNGLSLHIHLKMTGQLIFRPELGIKNYELGKSNQVAGGHPSRDWWATLPNQYTRVIFTFSDKSKLYFNDLRRFGWIRLENTADLNTRHQTEYGPEPLEGKFTNDYLYSIIAKKPKSNIKKIITDQALIAGVGNIYADESLFAAGILPTRLAVTLSKAEIERLHLTIINSLKLGIKHGGASDSDYVDATGKRGEMQNHFQVYGRTGQKCKRNSCQGIIKKIRLNGRGTHFCSACQK